MESISRIISVLCFSTIIDICFCSPSVVKMIFCSLGYSTCSTKSRTNFILFLASLRLITLILPLICFLKACFADLSSFSHCFNYYFEVFLEELWPPLLYMKASSDLFSNSLGMIISCKSLKHPATSRSQILAICMGKSVLMRQACFFVLCSSSENSSKRSFIF